MICLRDVKDVYWKTDALAPIVSLMKNSIIHDERNEVLKVKNIHFDCSDFHANRSVLPCFLSSRFGTSDASRSNLRRALHLVSRHAPLRVPIPGILSATR